MKTTILAIVLATLVLALPASAAKTISVPDTTHGGFTVATVGMNKPDSYVFVQCYQASSYVYAAYFPVTDYEATLGPLESSLWLSGAADCVATHGWFPAQGFGSWKPIADTTFQVAG